MKKTLVLLLVVCMTVSVLAGCSSNKTNTNEAAKDTKKSAEDYSETGTMNLAWSAQGGTDSLFESPWLDNQSLYPEMVFDTLVKIKEDGKTFVPKLASEWSISPDGKTYTFNLNKNAKWHDGTPFTQDDVLFSFNTAVRFPKFWQKNMYLGIEGVKDVIDGKAQEISGITAKDGVVTIKLSNPDNFLLKALCAFCILPKHLLKDADPANIGAYEAFWKKPIGTGAYKINEVSFPNYFTVTRNDDYFGPKAGIKNAVFTSYDTGGNEAVINAAIGGKIDFAFGNAVNDINTAKNITSKNADMKYLIIPSNYFRSLWYNTNGSADGKYNENMKKKEVRQALNLLIDKETVAGFYGGQAVAGTTLVNPKDPAYNSDIPLFKRDVAKAKQMLTDAGFDFSKTLRLLYYYKDQTTIDIMELIKQNFAEAGVKLEPFLAQGDLASLIYEKRNWDIMYAATFQPDPIKNYNFLVPAGGNYDKLFAEVEQRAPFKDIMTKYTATNDPAEQKKFGDEMQLVGNQLCYATGVYSLDKIAIYNSARLQIDTAAFSTDYQTMRDNRFENWKLLK